MSETERRAAIIDISSEMEIFEDHTALAPRSRTASIASSCTLAGDEVEVETESGVMIQRELIDLTIEDSENVHQRALSEGDIAIDHLDLSTDLIQPGDFIQVANTMFGNYKVEFVLVKVVVRPLNGVELVRGIPFARTRCMRGWLPKKLNELCMICYFDQPAQNTPQTPALVDVMPSLIDGKRSFIMTNAVYPRHNPKHTTFANIKDYTARKFGIEEHGVLVCRWKVEVYKLNVRRQNYSYEEVIVRLPANEVQKPQYRVCENDLRAAWRGQTARGGSWRPGKAVGDRVRGQTQSRTREQKYTLFDSFCGAGGVSRGAEMAGFHVQYAVDKSPDVWDTYQANFPQASLHMGSVDDFVRSTVNQQMKVDVLHLSPPCQPFSPAHTHAAAHDDENIFALTGCFALINATRPRIVTLEQTFGITHDRHGDYLRGLINDFTAQGFSVRWKVIRLATWGSAQDRKRLILVAAAPGESLLPFPPPSHSENGSDGLKPYNTINKALSQVTIGDDLHDVEGARRHSPPKPPLPGDRLAGTITTSPGGFYYPDGSRDLTLREYASLQGFPQHHSFTGTRTNILRQIGNAFPPNTVRHLYKHIEKWLMKQDRMHAYQPPASEVMIVDSG